jgi:hypothetical protein
MISDGCDDNKSPAIVPSLAIGADLSGITVLLVSFPNLEFAVAVAGGASPRPAPAAVEAAVFASALFPAAFPTLAVLAGA